MSLFSRSKAKPLNSDDTVYTGTDALILVMGPSGCGKSTFINNYLGRPAADVTNTMSSCTKTVTPYTRPRQGESPPSPKTQVVLVDTPGFFGGDSDELSTLEQISQWLRPKDAPERQLTGIVYLHDISQKRMVRETEMSLSLFRKICGENSAPKTILVKTQWPNPPDQPSLDRALELEGKFFKDMKNAGAKSMDIKGTVTEKSVIDFILTNDIAQDIILELQCELKEGKNIASTAAGQELRDCLLDLLCYTDPKSQKQQVAAIKRTIEKLNAHPSLGDKVKSWFRRGT